MEGNAAAPGRAPSRPIDWEDAEAANRLELAEAWTNDWDDETVEEDFANQLRAELAKLAA